MYSYHVNHHCCKSYEMILIHVAVEQISMGWQVSELLRISFEPRAIGFNDCMPNSEGALVRLLHMS